MALGSGGAVVMIWKTVDQTINNKDTFVTDDKLTLTTKPNASYAVEGLILLDTSDSADFKCRFNPTQDACIVWEANGEIMQADAQLEVYGLGGLQAVRFSGFLVCTATASVLPFQWAQLVAASEDTTVKAGSWMRFTELPA